MNSDRQFIVPPKWTEATLVDEGAACKPNSRGSFLLSRVNERIGVAHAGDAA